MVCLKDEQHFLHASGVITDIQNQQKGGIFYQITKLILISQRYNYVIFHNDC